MGSAIDAVKLWRYKPTLLNGEPVEVDTTITVEYSFGEQKPREPEVAIDPQFKADILHFLDVARGKEDEIPADRTVSESMRPILSGLLPLTPQSDKIFDAYIERFLALLQTGECNDQLIAVYAQYFSDDDIRALTQFYKTPAGRHFNEVAPRLRSDLDQRGHETAMDNIEKIFPDLCKEYPELEGDTQSCPGGNKGK